MKKYRLPQSAYVRIWAASHSSICRWQKDALPLDDPARMWRILQARKSAPPRTLAKGIVAIAEDWSAAICGAVPLIVEIRDAVERLADAHGLVGIICMTNPPSELSDRIQSVRTRMLPLLGELQDLANIPEPDEEEEGEDGELVDTQ